MSALDTDAPVANVSGFSAAELDEPAGVPRSKFGLFAIAAVAIIALVIGIGVAMRQKTPEVSAAVPESLSPTIRPQPVIPPPPETVVAPGPLVATAAPVPSPTVPAVAPLAKPTITAVPVASHITITKPPPDASVGTPPKPSDDQIQ